MAAKFTNLRPAEAKPIEQLRKLHTPLYVKGEASAFLDSIVNTGLPGGIGLAMARLATPDFIARAEFAQTGLPAPAGSPFTPLGGGLHLLEVAQYLARADPETLLATVRRGELMPAFAEHIAGAQDAPALGGTIVQDDLLAMFLVPGAFATYRRLLGKLLMLRRLIKDSGRSLAQLLLPATSGMIDDLHGPWPDDEVPHAWLKLLGGGRILLPANIPLRPVAAPGIGAATGTLIPGRRFDGVLSGSAFGAVDPTQFDASVLTDAASAEAPATEATDRAAAKAKKGKAKGV